VYKLTPGTETFERVPVHNLIKEERQRINLEAEESKKTAK